MDFGKEMLRRLLTMSPRDFCAHYGMPSPPPSVPVVIKPTFHMVEDLLGETNCPTCGAKVRSIFDHVDGCPGDQS